jgi:hypothetical protein
MNTATATTYKSEILEQFDGGMVFMHPGNKASGFVRLDDKATQFGVRGTWDDGAMQLAGDNGNLFIELKRETSSKPRAPKARGRLVHHGETLAVVAFLVPVEGGHALGLAEDVAPIDARLDAASW